MKRLILGIGISGLVLAECFKQNGVPDNEVVLIGKTALGQQSYGFNLGPRILHNTEKVSSFIRNIGIDIKPHKFNIGYIKDGKILEDISLEDKKFYANKNGKKLEKSTLSEGKKSILGWDLEEINLAQTLFKRHEDKIVQKFISKEEITALKDGYDEIYCTFPLNQISENFKTSLNYITYIYTSEEFAFVDKAYVYDLGNNKVKRISNFNGKSVYECIGSISELKDSMCEITKGKILNMVELKTTIVQGEKISHYDDMQMVGRFATNNHSERIDTIIEKYLGVL